LGITNCCTSRSHDLGCSTHELKKLFSSLTACKVLLKGKSRVKEVTIEVCSSREKRIEKRKEKETVFIVVCNAY
jgi:hypothetical protein